MIGFFQPYLHSTFEFSQGKKLNQIMNGKKAKPAPFIIHNLTSSLCCHFGSMSKKMCEKVKDQCTSFWDEIVNGRCPLRGIHSSERGIPATAAPKVSVPHQEAYSKSLYGECSWTGRQTGSLQSPPPGGRGVSDRDPPSSPGPPHFCLFGTRPFQSGQT